MWEVTFSSWICSLAHLQSCCSQKRCQGLKESTQNTGIPGQAGSFPGITGSRDGTAKPKTPGLCLSQLRTPPTCLSSLCSFCWQRGTERRIKKQTPVGLFKIRTHWNYRKKKKKELHESLDDKIWNGTYTTEMITDREHPLQKGMFDDLGNLPMYSLWIPYGCFLLCNAL